MPSTTIVKLTDFITDFEPIGAEVKVKSKKNEFTSRYSATIYGKLTAPTITYNGTSINISSVPNATVYEIYNDNTKIAETSNTTYNYSTAAAANIRVRAKNSETNNNSNFSNTLVFNEHLYNKFAFIAECKFNLVLSLIPLAGRDSIFDGIMEYSIDGNSWNQVNSTGDSIQSSETGIIYLRGSNNSYFSCFNNTLSTTAGIISFQNTATVNAIGDIENVLDYQTVLNNNHPTMATHCFRNLFSSCTNLVKSPLLPATTLSDYCYSGMFYDCKSLTSAPELLATTLTDYCYRDMFYNCTSLTTAPALPATTLASRCYYSMFSGCTSLTTAPELPATTLANNCYYSMFSRCTSLTTAPALPATKLAEECYDSMFENCSSLTTPPELPATTLANNCYDSMFAGCTSLTKAPKSSATTLASSCYNGMLRGTNVIPDCSNIDFTSSTVVASGGLIGLFYGTKVTDNQLRSILPINPSTNKSYLPVTTLTINCYSAMFRDCTSLTTAPALPATTLASRCYYSMFSGCTSLTTAPELPATTLSDYCYSGMFENCSSLTTPPELPATTLVERCYSFMFNGCTSLTTAPALPATVLKEGCYCKMFSGCTNLVTPAIMAGGTTQATAAKNCCYYMYYNCTSLNIYTSSSGHTACYKAIAYSTSSSSPSYQSSYQMFYNCKINGSTSTANYLTAGTQYYY